MTTTIRRWQDSDFYLSSAGTTNVREQLIKLQSIGKLVRALSDASTVDTNGDKLQDRLLGLSLGDLTQRHKWRVLYDNLNDRFLVQYNTGTDAAKVWVEQLRIDASGNLTTTGTLTIASSTTTNGGIRLGGDLDANGFYLKNVGQVRTGDLIADRSTNLNGTDTKIRGTKFFDISYNENGGNQLISAATLTDVTSLTALTLPNTAAPITSRKFLVSFDIQLSNTAGSENFVFATLYNGPNGTKSDTAIYISSQTMPASGSFGCSFRGQVRFTPAAANRTKLGLAIQSAGTSTLLGSAAGARCTMTIQEVP